MKPDDVSFWFGLFGAENQTLQDQSWIKSVWLSLSSFLFAAQHQSEQENTALWHNLQTASGRGEQTSRGPQDPAAAGRFHSVFAGIWDDLQDFTSSFQISFAPLVSAAVKSRASD